MAGITYGSAFRPTGISRGEISRGRARKSIGETITDVLTAVAIAASFIALSFIPVEGEAVATEIATFEGIALAEEIAADSSALASSEVLALAAENGEVADEVASTTGQIVTLGQTAKGSLALGLGEFGVNTAVDAMKGELSFANTGINALLSVLPVIGAFRATRSAAIRFARVIEIQIEEQKKLLALATEITQRLRIERRIAQLQNAKLARTANLFGSQITSRDVKLVRGETLAALELLSEGTKKTTVKKLTKEIRNSLLKRDVSFSKMEIRAIVRSTTKDIPTVTEGLTLRAISQSKIFSRTVKALQYADPNLAARKVITHLSRSLTSDKTAIIKIGEHEFGKRVNLGLYKKFGQKLSKF